jgi:3-dehydroquinate dehydratase-1
MKLMHKITKPQICTSIGVQKIEHLEERIKIAFEMDTDFIEIRVDYLDQIDFSKLKKIIERTPERFVLTCRSKHEGGKFNGGKFKRVKILMELAKIAPAYIDIEQSTDSNDPSLINSMKKLGVDLIISWHDFSTTPDLKFLSNKLDEAEKFGDIVKIVTMANHVSDNSTLFNLYKHSNKKLIAFCMGEKGLLSRILCPFFGAPFTFASLPNSPTAPAQVNIKELRVIYETIKKED